MNLLKQSTAATVLVGPVLDSSGGAYVSAVIADFNLTKNGVTAAMAAAATATHDHNGMYLILLTTGNTDTLGRFAISCNKSGYGMGAYRAEVMTSSVFDALITNATNVAGGLGDTLRVNGQLWSAAGTVTLPGTVASTSNITAAAGCAVSSIGADVITATSIASNAITDAKVASDVTIAQVTGSVGSVVGATGSIATGGIAAASFAAGAINAAAIASDAITDAKVAADVTIAQVTGSVGSVVGATGSIATGGITSSSFAAGAIDATAIATDAIGSAEISAAAVTKIQSGLALAAGVAVTSIGTGVITATSIASDAITGAKVAADVTIASVTGSVGSVTSAVTLANSSITASTFTAGAIDAVALATDAATEIATTLLDLALSGHTTSGTVGKAISDSATSTDPWVTALPGSYTDGQAGNVVGLLLDLLLADKYIDKETTPWNLVFLKQGTATELLRQDIKDLDDADLVSEDTIPGKVTAV